ncbi:MAG TPA: carboxypeptidase regulatory-like domain-containing protein [Candidatus Baltobacteraceae bacterium]
MLKLQFLWRAAAFVLVSTFVMAILVPQPAYAGNTGNITGTIKDASGKPVADVRVTAASASQTASGTSDAQGFYSILNLIPDTYTVSFQKSGFTAASVAGVVVVQDQTQTVNQQMQTALKTIASVRATGSSNLVKPNEGSDVYTVSGAQLTAATNPVNSLETIYQWMAVTPGVTATINSQPRIRGGQVTDLGYEFEGIPIQDRIVGFFTTNLSNTGLSNVEIYTGGLAGAGAVNGTGYFNSVLKTGTYPGFESLSFMASSPEQNQYLSFERGWASANHRFSYYFGFTGVNSANQYDYGEYSFPGVVFPWCYCDGPGPVKERNWVGNFHYHPDVKNDFQVVATNDLGDFNFNYQLARSPGEPLPLAIGPCPGAQPALGANGSYATGGTAANGQTCPLGLQWTALGNGKGNLWHHYGGLGKIQWNHNFSDHESMNFRLADNFNQYIFDQPMADPNIPGLENPGDPYSWTDQIGLPPGDCPAYPYTAGTPVQIPASDPYDQCVSGDGVQVFWGNRRSNIWQAAADYTNVLSDRLTIRAGASDEMDHNTFDYFDTDAYTVMMDGSLRYPSIDEQADYPTNQQVAYVNPDIHIGKLMLSPGLTYAQRHYGFPADQGYSTTSPLGLCPTGETCNVYSGGKTVHTLDPTFNGTYAFDPNDDLKFSWGDTTSFISSAYVYTASIAANTGYDQGHTTRNPFLPGTTFDPQQNHSAQLLFEHNFGNNTTMRIGPYYNKTSNYYNSYRPFLGYFVKGCNPLNLSSCTPCSYVPGGTCGPVFAKNSVLTNNGEHNTFGAEFAFNHINNAPLGTSFWISATYDNYWTTSTSLSAAYINSPLPNNLVNEGIRLRTYANPLWSGTFLADFHSNGFHFDPLVYYQGDTFFNTGRTKTNPATGLRYIYQNEQIAHGWWWTKLNVYKEFGAKPALTLGFTVSNLFNNTTDTTPCTNGDPFYAPWNGTGCWPFDGPQSGVIGTPGSLIYQNYSQSPRTFYFYAGVKM